MNTQMKYVMVLAFLLVPYILFSQNKTYKVVCDKTEKKLKVVEAKNRSSNLIPIKSGFPFPAVARQWIEDNYETDDCDPNEIANDIQKANQKQPDQTQTQNQQTTVQQQPSTQTQNLTAAPLSNLEYKNNSFGLDITFGDLGRYFDFDQNLAVGLSMDLEKVFGKQRYIGTGIHWFMLNSVGNSKDEENDDPASMYAFKIPVFVGSRSRKNRTVTGFDAGFAFNTKPKEIGEDADFRGLVPKSSFNLLVRVKIGNDKMQFEMGSDLWLSEIFENQPGKNLSVFYFGYRSNF
jgi:hypothetical protein